MNCLDSERIQSYLRLEPARLGLLEGPQSIRPQFEIYAFDTLVSTNAALWGLIEQGASAGTVAIAVQQQAGRGQWGRQWQSQPGGLYLSLALEPHIAATDAAQLTLCSAWGIAQSLRNLNLPVELKWPNDLVVGKQKLGGILTETHIQEGRITWAIVGVGLNWQNPVPESGINLQTVFTQQGIAPIDSLEHLIAIVLRGIVRGYQVLQQDGIQAVLQAYQALLVNLGQSVVIEGHPGVISGVSPSGELTVHLQPAIPHATPMEIQVKPGTISLGYR